MSTFGSPAGELPGVGGRRGSMGVLTGDAVDAPQSAQTSVIRELSGSG
jgi:hypothetical protein